MPDFNFEVLKNIAIKDDTIFCMKYEFTIFREISTDTLYISYNGNFLQMHDPKTCLPLTYETWKKEYSK